ncbi:multi-pass transmembrane [Cryptosporidium xiaoi]|uniref:Multi-pass transmembrane n=1 Tax=Cryptosporidium xiaoi TaxID=659607 RepID=A0AAV9XWN6_9CRYT
MVRLWFLLTFTFYLILENIAEKNVYTSKTNSSNNGGLSPMKLLEIDNEGNIVLNKESVETLKDLRNPIKILSSIGAARSGKSTILNLILKNLDYFDNIANKDNKKRELSDNKDEYKENYGIWWSEMNGTTEVSDEKIVLFEMDSLVIGRNINSSIKLVILGLLLSDKVLINVINDVDLVFVDYIRLLMSQTLQFSSLFIRRLNEYNVKNRGESADFNLIRKDEIKANIIKLIEKLYSTEIYWVIHNSNSYQENSSGMVDSSNEYMDWLKARIETYIWPETRGSHLYKNILDFINKHKYYRIPMISRMFGFSGNYSDKNESIGVGSKRRLKSDFTDICDSVINEILKNDVNVNSGARNYEEKRLTGRDIGYILEAFSEISQVFNYLKPLEIGNPNSKIVSASSLVENTIFIFGNKLEGMLSDGVNQPLLEAEAETIYNNTLKDMEHYWTSISEFDYFDYEILNRNIRSHFERQYKQIMEKNCELIQSYCLKVINVHITKSIDMINSFGEKLPVSKKSMSEFVDGLYDNTLNEIESSLGKSQTNSYKNSPCCKINKSGLLEKVEYPILKLNEKNRNEIEKIVIEDFKLSRQVLRDFTRTDELKYKVEKNEFKNKVNSLGEKAKKVYNSHIDLVGDSSLYSHYLLRLEEEIKEINVNSGIIWDSYCRKNSLKHARSLAIKHNISIRNKLTLPLQDKVILLSFENLKKEAIGEMNELYCSGESSWKNALLELENTIEEDMEQIIKENLVSLKNLLHRPLQYSIQILMNSDEKNKKNWSVFTTEARKIAGELLDESNEFTSGSINLDQVTKQKIIDIWVEQDLIKYRKSIIANQIFYYLKYIFYLAFILFVSFILIYRGSLNISNYHVYGFIFTIIIFSISFFLLIFILLPFILVEPFILYESLNYLQQSVFDTFKLSLVPKIVIKLLVKHNILALTLIGLFASLLLLLPIRHYQKKKKILASPCKRKDKLNSSMNSEVRTFVF